MDAVVFLSRLDIQDYYEVLRVPQNLRWCAETFLSSVRYLLIVFYGSVVLGYCAIIVRDDQYA